MLLDVRRIARASSTWRTLTEDLGRNDKAWWTQSALKSDKALSCKASVLTSNACTVLSPCKHHFKLCSFITTRQPTYYEAETEWSPVSLTVKYIKWVFFTDKVFYANPLTGNGNSWKLQQVVCWSKWPVCSNVWGLLWIMKGTAALCKWKGQGQCQLLH